MSQLTLRIFVRGQIASKEHGEYFWKTFLRCFPNHIPTGYGHGANPTSRFDPDRLDLVLKKWNRRTVYYEQDRLSLSVQILRPRSGTTHQTHTEILVCSFEDDPAAVKSFVYEISTAFMADYALAHILTRDFLRHRLKQRGELMWSVSKHHGEKFEDRRQKAEQHLEEQLRCWPRRMFLAPEIGSVNFQRGFIKDIYWLTVFGPAFVDFFGRTHILVMPAHEIRELEYGGIGVELTNGLADTPQAWQDFLVARAHAKEHLGHNVFFEIRLPRTHVYSGPKYFPPEK